MEQCPCDVGWTDTHDGRMEQVWQEGGTWGWGDVFPNPPPQALRREERPHGHMQRRKSPAWPRMVPLPRLPFFGTGHSQRSSHLWPTLTDRRACKW